MSSSDRPVVALCTAKDCARKRPGAHVKLRRALTAEADVVDAPCLGVCSGPVAVLDPLGTPVVIAQVRGPSRRAAAVAALLGDDHAARSFRREVKRKKLGKAILRARKAALQHR